MTERRLLPINALLAVCTPFDVNPSPLADAGFRVAALEVPLACDDGGNVTADVILMNDEAAHIVLCESKSGNNIKPEQALRYGKITPEAVVRAASINLSHTMELSIEVLYVGLTEHADRMAQSLESAGVDYPLLVAADDALTLLRADGASPQLREAFPEGLLLLDAPPVCFIPIDHESADSEFVDPVRSYLVRAMASSETTVPVPVLAQHVCAHYLSYGKAARGQILKKVRRAAKAVAAEHPTNYAYATEPGGGEGLIRIMRTPEGYDARGRTQAYQALSRLPRHRQRHPRTDPNQLDLLQELAEGSDSGDDDLEEKP